MLTLALTLTGCGSGTPQKTEEEIREEVRAELEAEMQAEADAEDNSDETDAASGTEQTAEDQALESDSKVERRDDVYYTDMLKAGFKPSKSFELVSDYYHQTDGYTRMFGYELRAVETVPAELIYNTEYDFFFLDIQAPIFDKVIIVENPALPNGEEEVMEGLTGKDYGLNTEASNIEAKYYEAAKASENHSVMGMAFIENIIVDDNEESGMYSVTVSAFTSDEVATDQMVQVQGRLTCNIAPYCLLLELSEPIELYGVTYDHISFEDTELENYVDRSNFIYNIEGFPMITDSSMAYVLEVDLSTAYDAMGYLMVKDYERLDADNTDVWVDHSSEDFPVDYYQSVIKGLCLSGYGVEEENIFDSPAMENPDFREAVDKITAKGYTFEVSNGYYKIISGQSAYNFEKMPTLDEICQIVGIDKAALERMDDGGYFMYSSSWSGEGIAFTVYHDAETLTGTERINYLNVTGPEYKISNIAYGDKVLKTINTLGQKLENIYSHHDDTFAKYVYSLDGYALTVNGIGFDNEAVVSEEDTVTSISLYELLD